MWDFIVAVGLVLALEGLMFAAFPRAAKQAMSSVLETPDQMLRIVGIVCALVGILVIWFVRG
ncbi:DUF2065 domain-containing protein [Pseudorhodoplanes sinuspersici]|uniref:Uncharacterized protein n=1 Tax=Pseudorhodoplanes sinuspersici TaxID=1235591 RepID=A0A1W6ZSU1_9HYPH|nr:DUF2065 domain-containing protein [Pseudorhodoplanes sinuspersici]ARQ00171.1 hypothetical protein CAK95_14610 [Pseudorhodoplanes sinuspersici]RKE67695.1 hypothetical protein DFP91_5463 [Pseudorhodoplanes sinuspersici]